MSNFRWTTVLDDKISSVCGNNRAEINVWYEKTINRSNASHADAFERKLDEDIEALIAANIDMQRTPYTLADLQAIKPADPEEFSRVFHNTCQLCIGSRQIEFVFPKIACPVCANPVSSPDEIRVRCWFCHEMFPYKESVFPELTLAKREDTLPQLFRFCSVSCLQSYVVVNTIHARP